MLGNWVLCGMGLSLCSHLSLYPIMLILPLTVMAYNNKVLYNNCTIVSYTSFVNISIEVSAISLSLSLSLSLSFTLTHTHTHTHTHTEWWYI